MKCPKIYDPKDEAEELAKKSVWGGNFVMPAGSVPLTFINRGLRRSSSPEEDIRSDTRIEPQSLPPPKYAPRPQKPSIDEFVKEIDGQQYLCLPEGSVPITCMPHPGPASIYPPAIPVPNLSKKSRGRTVPTKSTGGRTGYRYTYTCKVEGCEKVFGRHEHLKRHIRSLHTHEKPYSCALPYCDKTFARRDNLLQHERKHKHYQAFFDCTDPENYDGTLIINPVVIHANADLARRLIGEGKDLPPPLLDAIKKEEDMVAAAAHAAAHPPPPPPVPFPVVDMKRVTFAEGSLQDPTPHLL